MGARLSQPKGPGGTTEASVPSKPGPPPSPAKPFPRRINSRTIVAPVAAFTMACILFVYARTSIRAAKDNAQRHRNADSGGQGLDLYNEHRRRHGQSARLESGGNTVSELASEARQQLFGARKKEIDSFNQSLSARSEEEEKLRAMKGRMNRKSASED